MVIRLFLIPLKSDMEINSYELAHLMSQNSVGQNSRSHPIWDAHTSRQQRYFEKLFLYAFATSETSDVFIPEFLLFLFMTKFFPLS